MKTTTDRRSVLKGSLGGIAGLMSVPLLGGLAGCSGKASALPTQALSESINLITGAPGNVIALSADGGTLLVDSGSVDMAASVQKTLDGSTVHTLINTHYHHDQTGGNALFAEAGATIHSHTLTRQWTSAKYYVPPVGAPEEGHEEDSATEGHYIPALPEAGRPTEVFREQKEMTAGSESIEMGYLLEAHTRGDIYVYFRDSNILAVGDVASPVRDPELDWYAGGWIGGRADAMSDLLKVANADTLIVPAYGPVMTYAEFQAERDMMLHFYERITALTVDGHSAQDILNVGVMDEVDRKFDDPYKFLYDARKGTWAHYTNFGGSTV